jgi:RNA polymerase sigma-70 factor, ECF subfamily
MTFEENLVKIYPTVYRFALQLTKNVENAEDLTQLTIAKCIENKDKYKEEGMLKSWAFQIVRNEFINNWRLSKRRKEIINTAPLSFINNGVANADEKIRVEEILKAIDVLPNLMKESLRLQIEGYKYEEISIMLNIPIGTVKSRIFLARKNIKYATIENEKRIALKLQRNP